MSSQSYAEKLRHPKWQKRRLLILERDNWTCSLCGDKETELHVHHNKYTNEPWDAPNNDLICCCKYCHIIIEECKRFSKESNAEVCPISIIKDINDKQKCLYVYVSMDVHPNKAYAYLMYALDYDDKITISYFINKETISLMHETLTQNPDRTHV